jgi:hypothetical protein
MGAEAVFVPNNSRGPTEEPQHPGIAQTEAAMPEISVPRKSELPPSPQTPIVKQSVEAAQEFKTDVARNELAAANKLVVWGIIPGALWVIAGALSVPAFDLLVLAIPLQLYIVNRITKALKTNIPLRIFSLILAIVPLINIVLLLVLRSHTSKSLMVGNPRTNPTEIKFKCTRLVPAYVVLLTLYTVAGVSVDWWFPLLTDNAYFSVTKQLAESSPANLSKEEKFKIMLNAVAEDYNKKLPKEIDINMRLERISVEPDNLLTFHVTETSRPSAAINIDTFRASMTPRVRKDVCEKVDGKPYQLMKDGGAAIAFSYSGNDGNAITTIVITPSDCEAVRLQK